MLRQWRPLLTALVGVVGAGCGDHRIVVADLGVQTGGGGSATTGLVVNVTFDEAPLGGYTRGEAETNFNAVLDWDQGLAEGRAQVVEDGEGTQGHFLRIAFPRGTFGPMAGGAQFPVLFQHTYDELYLSFKIRFGAQFDFVRGGILPGLAGGTANTDQSLPNGRDGWSARTYWQQSGEALQVAYYPEQTTAYGTPLLYDLQGQRHFTPGIWQVVKQRIVMNTPGQQDGLIQAWLDGTLVLDRTGLRFRDVSSLAIDQLFVSAFFGGNTTEWAAAKDELVDFDDFVVSGVQ